MNGGGYERILSKQKAKDEALAWFVRVNSGDAGDAELRAHRRWLAASDDNRAEYERISGIWSDFDKVADPRLPLTMRKPPLGRRPGRRAFLAGGLATAAGLAAVTAINGLPAGFLADYSTGTGEQRSLTLADGSTVNLDADTALVVKFNDRERRLLLLSGRAFFAVAKDAHRPFVVEAASGTATALGTRFSVHEWGGNASVAVEESAVSVTAPDGSSAVLNVGESVSYGPGGMQQIARVDVESDLAWRRGKLIFEDRPLQQVVADVNRYRSGTIRILDAKLMDLRVSGIFNIAEPDAVLTTITETLPVRAVRLTDYLVLLRGT